MNKISLSPLSGWEEIVDFAKTGYFQRLDKADHISIKYLAESKWIVSLPSEKCKLFYAHENTYHFWKYFTDSKRDISFSDGDSKNPNNVKCK